MSKIEERAEQPHTKIRPAESSNAPLCRNFGGCHAHNVVRLDTVCSQSILQKITMQISFHLLVSSCTLRTLSDHKEQANEIDRAKSSSYIGRPRKNANGIDCAQRSSPFLIQAFDISFTRYHFGERIQRLEEPCTTLAPFSIAVLVHTRQILRESKKDEQE